jgi:hypothetical protein
MKAHCCIEFKIVSYFFSFNLFLNIQTALGFIKRNFHPWASQSVWAEGYLEQHWFGAKFLLLRTRFPQVFLDPNPTGPSESGGNTSSDSP